MSQILPDGFLDYAMPPPPPRIDALSCRAHTLHIHDAITIAGLSPAEAPMMAEPRDERRAYDEKLIGLLLGDDFSAGARHAGFATQRASDEPPPRAHFWSSWLPMMRAIPALLI